jgi:hypothetical protein
MQARLNEILNQCKLADIFQNIYPNKEINFDSIITSCKEYNEINNRNAINVDENLWICLDDMYNRPEGGPNINDLVENKMAECESNDKQRLATIQTLYKNKIPTEVQYIIGGFFENIEENDFCLILYDSKSNIIRNGFVLLTKKSNQLVLNMFCTSKYRKFTMILVIIVAVLLNCDHILFYTQDLITEFFENFGFRVDIMSHTLVLTPIVLNFYKENASNIMRGIHVEKIIKKAYDYATFRYRDEVKKEMVELLSRR